MNGKTIANAIRLPEVLLMMGFPVMGVISAQPAFHDGDLLRLLQFLIATFALAASIYLFNSWGERRFDSHNRRLAAHPLVAGEISSLGILAFSLLLFAISLLIFALGLSTLLPYAIAIKLIWLLYSNPFIHGKGIPIISTLIHLSGGICQVMLGYSFVRTPDAHGVSFAVYLALLFVAGHYHHEVKDYHADREAGVRTNAIFFGQRRGQVLSALFFVFSFLVLVAAMAMDLLSWQRVWPFLAILPGHLFAVMTWGLKLEPRPILRYQSAYRALFAAAGFLYCILAVMT